MNFKAEIISAHMNCHLLISDGGDIEAVVSNGVCVYVSEKLKKKKRQRC